MQALRTKSSRRLVTRLAGLSLLLAACAGETGGTTTTQGETPTTEAPTETTSTE